MYDIAIEKAVSYCLQLFLDSKLHLTHPYVSVFYKVFILDAVVSQITHNYK